MSTLGSPASVPTVTVSPEVPEFVKKRSMQGVLDHMLEATPRLFPTATAIRVSVVPDVALPNYYFVVWEVRVAIQDRNERARLRRLWTDEFLAACTPPLEQSFTLRLVSEGE